MIRSHVQADGSLVFQADNEGRADLRAAYASGGYRGADELVYDSVAGDNSDTLHSCTPESLGALTDAPIFCAGDAWTITDAGDFEIDANAPVWWFPNYQITDPWEVLKNCGRVVFTREESR